MTQSLTARAPAKLIISGEHSVLYGQAAIAIAVNRYTTTTASWCDANHINFKLRDLSYIKAHSIEALNALTNRLRKDYRNFLNGDCSIREVLTRPFELLQYSVASLLEHIKLPLDKGIEIEVDSSIPLGCGMGSSASAVISSLSALTKFLDLKWQNTDLLSYGRDIENLQHGNSSGVDLHLVTYGGCLRFQNGHSQQRVMPNITMYIVNTGKPESTTGECVAQVALQFKKNPSLANDFGAVTERVDQALISGNMHDFKSAITDNQRLLEKIGVVSDKVSRFIAELELNGACAKVCGSGAVHGDNAGVVLLLSEQDLSHIVAKHGYVMQTIEVDCHGTQII